MRNFQDTFKTRKRSFISAFSICMTVPLRKDKVLIRGGLQVTDLGANAISIRHLGTRVWGHLTPLKADSRTKSIFQNRNREPPSRVTI